MAAPAAPVESSPPEVVSLPIRADTLAELQRLAEADGVSVLKYLSDCISLRLWFEKQLEDGGKIITKPKHGDSRVITNR